MLNDPNGNGGQLTRSSDGSFSEYDFGSSEEAFAVGASAAYLSGFYGRGQNAIDGFNAAQAAFKSSTGIDPGLSTPVVDIGHRNGNTWVTMNMNELMDQLRANGARGEEESVIDVVGKISDGIGTSAETVTNLKIGTRYLGESAELISKGAAIIGPVITGADFLAHGYHPHQVADLTADLVIYGLAEASGPVGWVVGGLWFLGNMAYAHYHGGRSITQDAFDGH